MAAADRDPRTQAVPIVFADTETGELLYPHLPGGRRIWEAALIRREPDGNPEQTLHAFVSDFDVATADPVALDVGRFHERHPLGRDFTGRLPDDAVYVTEQRLAELVAEWTAPTPVPDSPDALLPVHLVAACPQFEDLGFADLLWRHLTLPMPRHHYHLVDVEALALGVLGWQPPWKSTDLSAALGVNRDDYGPHHDALADTRWARALYDTAVGWAR